MVRLTVGSAALVLTACAAQGEREPLGIYHDLEEIEKSVGYAQAVRSGEWLFVSGTIGRGETLDAQMQNAYERIRKALAAHGAGFEDIVRETIYTTDFEALIAAQETRKRFYGGHTPAATWVQISRLYVPGAKLEIEVQARLGN